MNRFVTTVFLLALVASLGGCTKRYSITTSLESPLPQPSPCKIGSIIDNLPPEFEDEKKPTIEDIEKFKDDLVEQLNKGGWLTVAQQGDTSASEYVVTGAITDFRKGSGVVRVLIGFGAGTARIHCTLELKDVSSGKVLFGGVFTASVSDWAAKGSEMYKQVAMDFAKALDKEMSRLGSSHQKR